MSNHTLEQQFLLEALEKNTLKIKSFEKLKKQYASKHGISCFSNIELLKAYRELIDKQTIEPHKELFLRLQKQKSRNLSGIAAITVVTRRWPCGGACLFCPDVDDMPKSYFPAQPAIMRAILNDFEAEKQMQARIRALHLTGHPTNKIDLHILGGSFSTHPQAYQDQFIKNCYDGANGFRSKTLEEAMKANEQAENRIIGTSIETRPDLVNKQEVINLRRLGVTRVELGVQSIYDDVLGLNRRGHGQDKVIEATKLLKDAGIKINYHIMPNLYGSTIEKDIHMFKELFSNPVYQPDLLKVYPCVVTKFSDLEKVHAEGKFTPYTDEELIDLLTEIKQYIPPHVRIMRLGRDIAAPDIKGGNKMTNIRQIVAKRLEEKGQKCPCIRCREIRDTKFDPENVELIRRDYNASDGKEIFLSFEDTKNDKLIALLRLRFPSQNVFLEELQNTALIRELHTYGPTLEFSNREKGGKQHLGFGKRLIQEAEKITKAESDLRHIAVISGIGVRGYYKKQGYNLKGTYMSKELSVPNTKSNQPHS